MRVTLPESARHRTRSYGGTAFSTLVHTVVIGGIVASTGYTAERVSAPSRPEQVTLVSPRRDPPPAQPETPRPPIQQHIATNLTTPPPANLTPISFDVPDRLPPIDARIGTMSVTEFSRAGRDSAPAVGPAGIGDEPYNETMVDRQVMAHPGNAPPRYPAMLRSAGVEGLVHAQFVVDTAGRVERESIRFTRSGHPLFAQAVTEALLRSRYAPAEAGGRRVRQLVQQSFSFALQR